MTFTLDRFEITIVSGGRFKLDGGAMFGVVPKPLWNAKAPADEQNRIALGTNCLLIRGDGFLGLVDTGYGVQPSPRERELFAMQGRSLLENLAGLAIDPAEITHLILSHLHFDHVGGASAVVASGDTTLAFPNAEVVVQRDEWIDATSNLPELAGTYLRRDLAALERCPRLRLIEGDTEIVPGVWGRRTGCHTPGHQLIEVGAGAERAVYLGDLCPTTAHLRTAWVMAYDQYPRMTRQRKPEILGMIADRGWIACFDHDPVNPVVRLTRDLGGFSFSPYDTLAVTESEG